ncbi:MAG: DUF1572 family protein [Lunatimonas sp.]|uniref:DUF1572 family protein n=1 Tax=Lunatimonas sp. TaxID=2060141 RepID=UPI00263ACF08|nr:DUF1572 family protein [Lunatimonas sp.]MCC5937281.1 DUF1572 family protein [Lunatimonas sp.]
MSTTGTYLESTIQLFRDYKAMGEKAMSQIPSEKLFYQFNEDSNSVAMLVNHLNGNMLSRWTDFLQSNGEKPWRERDAEFEPFLDSEAKMWEKWEEGWACFFAAVEPLQEADLVKIVRIGHKDHTVVDAISRQLAHYAAHIGQIVYLAKILSETPWQSLSVPKGKSPRY